MSQNAACQHAQKRWIPSAPSWVLGGLAVCALWLGGFSAVQAQEKTAGRQIEALGELYDLQNKVVTDAQSRIIFYRPADAKQGGAATVFINGRYHASLVPGAYSPVCVKPGPVNLSVRWMEVHRRANKDGFDSISELALSLSLIHI
jgi:OOP family OmpA-OmpF porin